MGFNSVAILGKRTMRYSIPHLQAAESGGKAPVVKVKNTLKSAIGTMIKGNIQTLMSPGKAFVKLFTCQ